MKGRRRRTKGKSRMKPKKGWRKEVGRKGRWKGERGPKGEGGNSKEKVDGGEKGWREEERGAEGSEAVMTKKSKSSIISRNGVAQEPLLALRHDGCEVLKSRKATRELGKDAVTRSFTSGS